MSIITLESVNTLTEMRKLKSNWKDLVVTNTGSSVFQSWHWNYSWCEEVLPTIPNSRINVYVAKNNNDVVMAIIPLYEQTLANGFFKLSQFIGHRMSINNGILTSETGNKEFLKYLIRLISKKMCWNQFLFLRHMDENSFFTKQLYKNKYAVKQCTRISIIKDPSILDQSTRLGRSKRKSYRWSKNQIENKLNGEVIISVHNNFEDSFDELIALHHKRLKELSKSSVLNTKNTEFLKKASKKLAENNQCEILSLKLQGNTIASVLLIYDTNICYFNQCGFDSEFYRLSPLRILVTEAMRHAFFDRNCNIFDLGPGYEAYKSDWSPINIGYNYFGCIHSDNPVSKIIAKLITFAFVKSLPENLITSN